MERCAPFDGAQLMHCVLSGAPAATLVLVADVRWSVPVDLDSFPSVEEPSDFAV